MTKVIKVSLKDDRTEERKLLDQARSAAVTQRWGELIKKLPSVLAKIEDDDDAEVIIDMLELSASIIASLVKRTVTEEYLEKVAPEIVQAYLTAQAKAKARIRVAKDKDGKQAAKKEAKKLWVDWQSGKSKHKSGAAFARFVCDKHPVLENPTTVERWAREWTHANSSK